MGASAFDEARSSARRRPHCSEPRPHRRHAPGPGYRGRAREHERGVGHRTSALASFGEIREYQPHRHAGGRAVGLPSDDTQMAFWTLAQLLEDGGYVPENVARCFTKRRIFGIGGTVRQFLVRFHFNGLPWHEAGTQSAGNGALMRIPPMLLPHLGEPSPALWADTALSAMTTHNDAAAITSAVAFIGILWDLLGMETAPTQEWWVERYVSLVSDLETDTLFTPRAGRLRWLGREAVGLRRGACPGRSSSRPERPRRVRGMVFGSLSPRDGPERALHSVAARIPS